MKPQHRFTGIACALAVCAGPAVADRSVAVRITRVAPEPVDMAALPTECKQVLSVPADSTSEAPPWDQRISLASCRQSLTVEPTSDPSRYPAMIARIDHMVQPSLAIYRDAMNHGPTPQIRMIAAHALGMTYVDTMVRARNSVRVPTGAIYGGSTYGSMDPYQALHQPLEPLLAGDRDAAIAAFREVTRLAEQNPATAPANPVMVFVVANARAQASQLRPSETTPNISRR